MKRLLAVVVGVLAGAVLALGAVAALPNSGLFGSTSETRDTQIISAITRKEQVVLLSLGIQGISETNERTSLFGINIPGSSRASFVQYAFNAKLGIEGGDVRIEKTGESAYLVSIPEFIFIGHDDESFKLVAEDNGVLSFVTPEIDPVEVINGILNDETQDQYVKTNQEILRDQAEVFYKSIITSIDPAITVRFDFQGGHR